jgi:hypothetical protein
MLRTARPILSLLIAAFCIAADTPSTQPDRALYVEVYLRNPAGPNQRIGGTLVTYDDQGPTIHTFKETRTFLWTELTPSSAFVCRSRVIDKTKAADWLDLGRFGWSIGAKDQALGALDRAVELDPTLRDAAKKIRDSTPGSALKPAAPPTTAPGSTATTQPPELIGLPPMVAPAAAPAHQAPLVKFTKSTPQQDDAAIAAAIKDAAKFEQELNLKLTKIDTAHFILFTDWDPREDAFLRDSLENTYAAVSKQFDIPPDQNIFVGRLPVYMFAQYTEFAKFSTALELPFKLSPSLRGYYSGRRAMLSGIGAIAMWKPTSAGIPLAQAQREWAHTLEHEFTHAFVNRYRSNRQIPRWLNEGLAEFISIRDYPLPGYAQIARLVAANGQDLTGLFNDENLPTAQMYPVMKEMVELLINRDRAAFLKYIDAIKDGQDPEQALQKLYGLDYPGLVKAWRPFAISHH